MAKEIGSFDMRGNWRGDWRGIGEGELETKNVYSIFIDLLYVSIVFCLFIKVIMVKLLCFRCK